MQKNIRTKRSLTRKLTKMFIFRAFGLGNQFESVLIEFLLRQTKKQLVLSKKKIDNNKKKKEEEERKSSISLKNKVLVTVSHEPGFL